MRFISNSVSHKPPICSAIFLYSNRLTGDWQDW